MRMRLNITYEAKPNDTFEVMAWQADFIALERQYPEVDLMDGRITKLEHISFLGWSTLHRANRTDLDYDDWCMTAEVKPVDDDELAPVTCPECKHEFEFNIDEWRRAKAKAEAEAAKAKEAEEAEGEGEALAG